MKTSLTNQMKIRTLAIFAVFFSCFQLAMSGEFLVIDKEITWSISADTSFNWFLPDAGVPSNWLSPADYYNGTWYIRYEVKSVATNASFGMQFGIIQHDTGRLYEQPVQRLQGAGDVVYHNSSPSGWLKSGGGVDFTKVSEIQNLCAIIYSWSPLLPLDPGKASWSQRFNWFPVTLRISVVAVSSGSSFSGWAGYLNIKKPTPDYAIDYPNERTDKIVPATDEYSYNADMSGAVSGNGQKLALTPGQDVYFRTKASGDMLASDIQHLVVPLRPTASIAFAIDYINEKTVENVSTAIEYSTKADFTSPVSGTGAKVTLIPGQDLYFRMKATASAFASAGYKLTVNARPAAPSVTINYVVESTNPIASTMEYSTDSTFTVSTAGTGIAITVTPGQNLYFRYKATASAFSSKKFLLVLAVRPATPVATVNYATEKTVESFTAADEYSDSPTFTSTITCTGTPIPLTPGKDLFVRVKPTASSFASLACHLVVPNRPTASIAFTIDYINEKTVENVPSTIEYSTTETFVVKVSGTGNKITLTPGQDLYFRIKATASSFASAAFYLAVDERPLMYEDYLSINYVTEYSNYVIDPDMEYTTDSTFTVFSTGTGIKIKITPGQDLYFRIKASASNFVSKVYRVNVPERPATPIATIDYAAEKTVESLPSTIEYSKSPSGSAPISCTGTPISLIPGQDLWIWVKSTNNSFASSDLHLVVPDRPTASIIFTIDYINEKTAENVASNMEYSASETFEDKTSGTGNKVPLIPGQDMYFRIKATTSSFASTAFYLAVGERPPLHDDYLSINYITEYTNYNIDPDMEYTTDSTFAVFSTGTGDKIRLTPGQDVYFRIKATVSSFASEVYWLIVPERPATPVATIDYAAVKTVESFPATIEYSKYPTYTSPVTCSGEPIPLTPGQDLLIWVKPTNSSFASFDCHLVVPEMPYLEYTGGNMVNTYFSVKAVLDETMTGFDLTDVSVINGQAKNLRADNWFDVYPDQKGDVHVIIPYNTFAGASFASNEVIVYYDSTLSVVPRTSHDNFSIFPNPSHTGLIYINTTISVPYTIDVISGEGSTIKSVTAYEKKYQQVDLQGLPRGIYYLKIHLHDKVIVHKVILD
jgi:hypothetical protein